MSRLNENIFDRSWTEDHIKMLMSCEDENYFAAATSKYLLDFIPVEVAGGHASSNDVCHSWYCDCKIDSFHVSQE